MNTNAIDPKARERLMEAATPLFAAKGLEGTTTREIAAAADLNVSLISYYFGGKEGLYRGILEAHAHQVEIMAKEFIGEYQKKDLTKETFSKFVYELIDKIVTQKLRFKDVSLIMQREMSAGLPYAREVHEKNFSKIGEMPAGMIAAAQKKKVVRADVNPHFALLTLVHAIDGYIMCSEADSSWIKSYCFSLQHNESDFKKALGDLFLRGILV
ncbi:MAG: TetR family transcriptional regulator [Pseudobdellovibrionaceae bacterium]